MAKSAKKPRTPAPEMRRVSPLTLVLLLAAGAVVAGTVWILIRPPWAKPPRAPEPALSLAEKTRRSIEALLAKADAIAPGAGPVMERIRRQTYATAIEQAKRYIQLEDPRDIVVRPVLARAQLRLGQAAEAEETLDALLRLSPQAARELWMKGQLVRRRGAAGAEEFFRRAAASDQADAEIWSRYGLELLRRGRFVGADTYLRRAADTGHRDVPTLRGLAALAGRARQYERAARLLDEAVRQEPGNVDLRGKLAEAQRDAGRLADAERTVRRALELHPSGALWMLLGNVLFLQRDRRPQAAEAFAKAAEFPSTEALAAFRAARGYYFLGKYALAMKYIDRAAVHGRDVPEIRQWVRRIENERFGEPVGQAGPGLRLSLPSGLPPEPESPNQPATQPAPFEM
jgi:tetratricopeptide (TPR) repeat protein